MGVMNNERKDNVVLNGIPSIFIDDILLVSIFCSITLGMVDGFGNEDIRSGRESIEVVTVLADVGKVVKQYLTISRQFVIDRILTHLIGNQVCLVDVVDDSSKGIELLNLLCKLGKGLVTGCDNCEATPVILESFDVCKTVNIKDFITLHIGITISRGVDIELKLTPVKHLLELGDCLEDREKVIHKLCLKFENWGRQVEDNLLIWFSMVNVPEDVFIDNTTLTCTSRHNNGTFLLTSVVDFVIEVTTLVGIHKPIHFRLSHI